MDIEVKELFEGKPTIIGKKAYFKTANYVGPFFDRLSNYTDDFRIHVQTPEQITVTETGDTSSHDTTYNRVYIEAVMPDEDMYANHDKVIGMVMGLDVRKPVVKFYSGALNAACTNLCIFSPSYLSIQALEPETPIDFKPLEHILELKDETNAILTKLHEEKFENSVEAREQLLGKWVDNTLLMNWNNGFQPVKLSVDNIISAYKSLFLEENSDYYQVGDTVNMYDVYNAMTQQITNMVTKGRDVFSIPEKTLLAGKILGIQSLN